MPTRFALVFGVLALLLLACLPAFTQQLAPMNPDYLAAQLQPAVRAESSGLGYRPAPVDFSYLKGQHLFASTRAAFPTAYDLRTLGKVTPVRNQNPLNTCWTFASYGSLESCLLPGENRDFSEINMARTHGFALGPDMGGSQLMALAYLARWSGPVNETDDPYTDTASPPNLPAQKHLQDAMIIPDRGGPLDNDNIKQAVMSYGGVYSTVYWTPAAFNFSTNSFYYAGSYHANHSITIAGWDDSYPSSRFPTPPPGNGAFIVKNSWGASWGDHGYFYVSYYDSNIGLSNMCLYNAESPANYAHIYQYDPFGLTGHTGYNAPTAWFANIFTATGTESLGAASFYAASPNSGYEVDVYLNPTGSPVSSTTPVAQQTGTLATPGYHTVKLAVPVALNAGQRFAVVVKISTPGYGYPIPLEQQLSGYTPNAVAAAGQSFMSADGRSWTDVTTRYPNANVCLKAFTQNRTVTTAPARPDLLVRTPSETSFTGGSVYNLTGSGQTKLLTTSAGVPAIYYLELSNPGDVSGTFSLTGPMGTSFWPVHYYDAISGGTDVTSAVSHALTGGWSVVLGAHAVKVFRAEVTPSLGVTAGATNMVLVKAVLAGNTTLADVVDLQTSLAGSTPSILPTVSLTASPISSQYVRQPVLLTARLTSGSNMEYAFVAMQGSAMSTLRGYSTLTTCTWMPPASGTYTIYVFARQIGSTHNYDAQASVPYTIR